MMTPEALQLLKNIDERQERMETRQEKLITVLVGDLDHEHPRARLPLLEAWSSEIEHRLEKVETRSTQVMAISAFIAFVAGLLSKIFVWHK
jgi:hypothetical protein